MRARNYILSRLENFENKAPIIIENYTIEHIMPQNKNLSSEWQADLGAEWQEVQKKYLHTIGKESRIYLAISNSNSCRTCAISSRRKNSAEIFLGNI